MRWESVRKSLPISTIRIPDKVMTARPGELTYANARILLFTRAPRPGKVKTRLIPDLGEAGALAIHVQLVRRQLEVLASEPLCPAQLWLDEPSDDPLFDGFNGQVFLQCGEDLGQRMYHAASIALKEAEAVIIIGSDCPGLDRAYLAEALHALSSPEKDVVIGPAEDGGYVLIGLKVADSQLFRNIDWGTDRVLQQTLQGIRQRNLGYQLLRPLCDVDTKDDLVNLL